MGGLVAIPGVDDHYSVAEDSVEAFQRDGHVFLPAVASADAIAKLRPIVRRVVQEETKDVLPLEERDAYGKSFLQVWGLQTKSESLQPVVHSQRFARIAALLMGVPRVRFFYSQAFFKEPGGGFTAWHQDQVYWPVDTEHSITMWLPLVDVSPAMGSMQFVSGSHKGDHRTSHKISERSEAAYQQLIDDRGLNVAGPFPFRAGDVTFHAGWVMHRAPGNATSKMREAMSISWFADGARLAEGKDEEWDWRWFPDQKPGELAGGSLTPIVYPPGEDHPG